LSKHGHLYDRRWRRRRERQLRAEPLCRLCLALRGRTVEATIADHVVPHRGDPELFEGELQSLCAPCHDSWKRAIEEGGTIKGCDASGRPLDPAHHWNTRRGADRGVGDDEG
jgi:hypothetical protein